jgi:adenylyltransferase/sulfurtransferase
VPQLPENAALATEAKSPVQLAPKRFFAYSLSAETGAKQMAVKVMIPTPLRVYTGKRDSTEVSAKTVGEALSGLTTQFGDLKKHLFTEDGKLRSFVNVYVNDEDIRYLNREATPTKDGDTISIVPSIAGGGLNCCSSIAPCCC